MQNRRIPLRMCTGCGEMKDKRELVRIVKNKEGNIFVDLTGKQAGRGAYICRSAECLKKAIKSKRIERTFSSTIQKEIYDRLEEEIMQNE